MREREAESQHQRERERQTSICSLLHGFWWVVELALRADDSWGCDEWTGWEEECDVVYQGPPHPGGLLSVFTTSGFVLFFLKFIIIPEL